jgi:hypothetical protein
MTPEELKAIQWSDFNQGQPTSSSTQGQPVAVPPSAGTSPRSAKIQWQPMSGSPSVITPEQEHQARVEALVPSTESQFSANKAADEQRIKKLYEDARVTGGPAMPPPSAGQGFSLTDIPVLGHLAEKGLSWAASKDPEGRLATWYGGGNQMGDTEEERYKNLLAYQDAYRQRQQQEDPYGYLGTRIQSGVATMPLMPNLKAGQLAETVGSKVLEPVAKEMPSIVEKGLKIAGRPVPAAVEGGLWTGADVAAGAAPNSSASDYREKALKGFQEGAETGYTFGLPLTLGTSAIKLGRDITKAFWDPEGYAASAIAERNAQATPKQKSQGITPEKGLGLSEDGKSVLPIDIAGAKGLAEESATVPHAHPELMDLSDKLTDRFNKRSVDVGNDVANVSGRPKNPANNEYLTDFEMREKARMDAQSVNGPAYRAAYDSPNAQAIWNDDLARVVNTNAGAQAVEKTIQSEKLRAAKEGREFVNPFYRDQNGKLQIDQNVGIPNLEFWDRFKRHMNDTAEGLKASGYKTEAEELNTLLYGDKNAPPTSGGGLTPYGQKQDFALVPFLKSTVPEYETALSGARKFIKEDNAFDGGAAFFDDANVGKKTKNATIADGKLSEFNQMTDQEKQTFRQGLLSRITANPADAAKIFASNDAKTLNRYREVLGDKVFNDVDNTLTLNRLVSATEFLNPKLPTNLSSGESKARGILRTGVIGGVGGLVGNYAPMIMQYIAERPVATTLGAIGTGVAIAGSAVKSSVQKTMVEKKAAAILDMMSKGDPATFKKIINAGQTDRDINEALRAIEYGVMRTIAVQSQNNEKRATGGRTAHASGGRTGSSAKSKADRLIGMVDHIRKSHGKETSSLLNLDDDTVAKALDIANQRI